MGDGRRRSRTSTSQVVPLVTPPAELVGSAHLRGRDALPDAAGALERRAARLETAYEELQSTVEELETTNEELQSTNEELETTNEELQSTNEELETMNEELQSTNEELETMNDELRAADGRPQHQRVPRVDPRRASTPGVVVIDSRAAHPGVEPRARNLWGIARERGPRPAPAQPDIGLPVDELRQPLRGSALAARRRTVDVTLAARNRRGRTIVYRSPRAARRLGRDTAGRDLLMEEHRPLR